MGGWKAHPHNPVNMDINSARPADNVFAKDGRLFRFGQIGKEYGWGIAVIEITTLSLEYYEEKIIEVIEPRWHSDIIGIHTLNIYPGIAVADCKLTLEWET